MKDTVETVDEEPPTHPETLTDCYPWIRYVDTLPTDPHPEDYLVSTNLGIVEMDEHVHALNNHGYEVKRIAPNQPKGMRMYANIH